MLLDDGCDLISTLHQERPDLLQSGALLGASEQTGTGVLRLRQLARDGALSLPVAAVNDTPVKRVVDNRGGAGSPPSTRCSARPACCWPDACRSGRLRRRRPRGGDPPRGLGAHVVVTEVDPVAALDAALDGFRVLPMAAAAAEAHVIVTATGGVDVVGAAHLALLRDGVVLANAGHFDVEVDVRALLAAASDREPGVRPSLDEYTLPDGRRVLLVAEGRVAGLAAAEGSPPAIMDLAFALQALTVRWLVDSAGTLAPGVHDLPADIDSRVAALALQSLGFEVDRLSGAQATYLRSWRSGS